jgi:hypothetical protein
VKKVASISVLQVFKQSVVLKECVMNLTAVNPDDLLLAGIYEQNSRRNVHVIQALYIKLY